MAITSVKATSEIDKPINNLGANGENERASATISNERGRATPNGGGDGMTTLDQPLAWTPKTNSRGFKTLDGPFSCGSRSYFGPAIGHRYTSINRK